ncbi:MAG TPA: CdaR family protein [Anaerolineales bacterium]|jgi:YbbR domain-containing protein
MNRFIRNFRTLLLALVLALAVWVSAVTAADPDEVHEYPQPVPLQIIGQDPGLVIVGNVPSQVTITLRAPKSVWNQLNANDGQVRAILDLSGLLAGNHQLEIQPQVSLRPVRVVSVSPKILNINLEPLATITIPIQLALRGEPAVGYEAGLASLETTQAVVSGPQSEINKVARAQVDLSIAGVRQDVQSTLPVRVLDAGGKVVGGLTVNPENIQVSQPVTQQGGYRDIAVKVTVRGQQAGGYRVTNISVFPPVITVYSKNPAIVNDLPGFVETEALNLNGESQNVDVHLKLNIPQGVSIVGDQTVQVQVGIAAIEGSLSLNGIPVTVIGLVPGLQAHISPGLVDVILTGPLPVLDKLTPGDIKFVVDLTGLESGTHQATPVAQILIPDIRVQSINPGTIEVIITPAGPQTTTPTVTPTVTPTAPAR